MIIVKRFSLVWAGLPEGGTRQAEVAEEEE
jgi:hypothetical protein